MARINTSKNKLATALAALISVQPEGEDWLGYQSVLDNVVPQGNNIVNADALPGQPQQTIKLGSYKGQTGLIGCLSEDLVLHLKASKGHGVL